MSLIQAAKRVATFEKYRLDSSAVRDLVASQDGACAICADPFARDGYGILRFAIDHDHRTDAVRGLLCTRCNTGLGQFRDSEALLIAAVAYLRRAKP